MKLSSSSLATSRSCCNARPLVRLRTTSKVMPKNSRLITRPLASTKGGRLISALCSKAGSVVKYRVHSRPATSIRLSLKKRNSFVLFSSRLIRSRS